ncbi:MAG: PAS domain-containing protein [Xenococcaceae cyanobacterium MO_167.B52]|nr:PAS domain-containing protein [Xenococcaceae cyanobacterium MO_167.B52]
MAIQKDGSYFWANTGVSLVLDATGKPKHTLAVINDICDRKYAELALQESENRDRKVVEAQTDFILRSRPDTTITFANQSLCQVLDLTTEEIIGREFV